MRLRYSCLASCALFQSFFDPVLCTVRKNCLDKPQKGSSREHLVFLLSWKDNCVCHARSTTWAAIVTRGPPLQTKATLREVHHETNDLWAGRGVIGCNCREGSVGGQCNLPAVMAAKIVWRVPITGKRQQISQIDSTRCYETDCSTSSSVSGGMSVPRWLARVQRCERASRNRRLAMCCLTTRAVDSSRTAQQPTQWIRSCRAIRRNRNGAACSVSTVSISSPREVTMPR
jgi:hypothetical protein